MLPDWVYFGSGLVMFLGSLATIGSFAYQLLERREKRLLTDARRASPTAAPVVRKAKASSANFSISRARIAVITVFLLAGTVFTTIGLIANTTRPREEPLKPSLRAENLEATLPECPDS